jgi:hypothetical protein
MKSSTFCKEIFSFLAALSHDFFIDACARGNAGENGQKQ